MTTVSDLDPASAENLLGVLYYNQYPAEQDNLDTGEHWDELPYMFQGAFNQKTRKYDLAPVVVKGVSVSCVEDFGGEGQGDTRYCVFKFEDSTGVKYFRKDGYYASYDGSTWDGDFKEVTPQERIVTFYE